MVGNRTIDQVVQGYRYPTETPRSRRLSSTDKLVYVWLLQRINTHGEVYYSHAGTAKSLSLSERQVQYSLARLKGEDVREPSGRVRLGLKHALIRQVETGGTRTTDTGCERKANKYMAVWHPVFDGGKLEFSDMDPVHTVHPVETESTAQVCTHPGAQDAPTPGAQNAPAPGAQCAPKSSIQESSTNNPPEKSSSAKAENRAGSECSVVVEPENEAPKPKSSIDDEERGRVTIVLQGTFLTATDKLKALVAAKSHNGQRLRKPDLEQIEESLEEHNATIADLIEMLTDQGHVWNRWKNPIGLVKDKARQYKAQNANTYVPKPYNAPREHAARPESKPEPAKCPDCFCEQGKGAVLEGDFFAPCKCATPEFADYLARKRLLAPSSASSEVRAA